MSSLNPVPGELEPVPLPEEPRTPMWLPMLGGVTLLVAIVLLLVLGRDEVGQQSNPAQLSDAGAAPSPTE